MAIELIDYEQLSPTDIVLPGLPQPYLTGIKEDERKFYLGLPDWTYHDSLKKKNSPQPVPGSLPYYAHYFNAVEIEAGTSNTMDAEKIRRWCNSLPDAQFKFCPEINHDITHKGLLGKQKLGLTKDFGTLINNFKENLGPALLTLDENYGAENQPLLLEYLRLLPAGMKLAVAFKNTDWFGNPVLLEDLLKELAQLQQSMLITDIPGQPELRYMQLTNSTAFIRFHCRGWNEIDLQRINEWKKQLHSWFLQGMKSCYFMLHIHDQDDSEDFIEYVKDALKF